MRVIDLRSDTVTLPTEEMLEAIRTAELGDDVYGEDPTVNRLEELAAKKMGKEAALLVTSGTQANLVSVMSQTKRGDEIVLEAEAHLYYYEVGAFSTLGEPPRRLGSCRTLGKRATHARHTTAPVTAPRRRPSCGTRRNEPHDAQNPSSQRHCRPVEPERVRARRVGPHRARRGDLR